MEDLRTSDEIGTGFRRTRLASYAICYDAEGRILLCRINSMGGASASHWIFPGGGVEWGESPQQAVLREMTEETGLQGKIESMIGVYSTVRSDTTGIGEVHAVSVVFGVTVTGGELRDETDNSTDRCAWLSAQDMQRLPLTYVVRQALGLPPDQP